MTAGLLLAASTAFAQLGTSPYTTTLNLTVGPEAALTVANNTTLASTGTNFNPYTGSTALTYFIRTTKTGGTGNITLTVTTDFTGANNGPSLVSPPTAGDALTYTPTVAAPGTAATGPLTASHTVATAVAIVRCQCAFHFCRDLWFVGGMESDQ